MKNYLLIFLVSMVPLVELRGAIPISQGLGLPLIPSYLICILGNMIPVPIIYLFARRVLIWGNGNMIPVPIIYLFARRVLIWGSGMKGIGKFFTWCLQKGERGGKKLQEKAGRGLFWALMAFVAIPLPGTGAWTGTLAASILDMDFKSSVLAVMLGVLIAGVIMMLVSAGAFGALRAAF